MDYLTDPHVLSFRESAESFCQLLETKPEDTDQWVVAILAALARLYSCGHAMPDGTVSDDAPDMDVFDVQDDQWRDVCLLVHQTLGKQAGYWGYFDPSELPTSKDQPVMFDLGDDLADIYRDVKPGLRAWEAGLSRFAADIVNDWKCLFDSHWGVHAVGAMRALHPLALLRGIQKWE